MLVVVCVCRGSCLLLVVFDVVVVCAGCCCRCVLLLSASVMSVCSLCEFVGGVACACARVCC